jgi:hypothetical protein
VVHSFALEYHLRKLLLLLSGKSGTPTKFPDNCGARSIPNRLGNVLLQRRRRYLAHSRHRIDGHAKAAADARPHCHFEGFGRVGRAVGEGPRADASEHLCPSQASRWELEGAASFKRSLRGRL